MAKKPPLSIEQIRQLIEYNPATGKLTWIKRTPENTFGNHTLSHIPKWNGGHAGKEALRGVDGFGYLHGAIFSIYYRSHRVAWALYYGEWPDGEVDHINGDRVDNRIDNLRVVNHRNNMRNCQISRRNTSGVTGVHFDKKISKWIAAIHHNGKTLRLGTFKTLPEAAHARKLGEAKCGYHSNHGSKRGHANKYVKKADRVQLHSIF